MQGSYAGVAPYLHSPLYAAQQAGFSVAYAQGADINSDNTTGFAAALALAKVADTIVYLGGIDDTVEAEAMVSFLNAAEQEALLYILSHL
jgi:beta-D-xylosidase 4